MSILPTWPIAAVCLAVGMAAGAVAARVLGGLAVATALTGCANLKVHVSASYMNDAMAAEVAQANARP